MWKMLFSIRDVHLTHKHLFSFPVLLLGDLPGELLSHRKNFLAFPWHLIFQSCLPNLFFRYGSGCSKLCSLHFDRKENAHFQFLRCKLFQLLYLVSHFPWLRSTGEDALVLCQISLNLLGFPTWGQKETSSFKALRPLSIYSYLEGVDNFGAKVSQKGGNA